MVSISASRLARGVTVALASTVLSLGVVAPATASSDPQDCMYYEDDDVLVCVPVGDDLAAAFTDQTGYTVVPSTDDGESLVARGVLVVYSLVTLYSDAGYGGSSYTITRSTACNGVTVAAITDLGAVGLNNVVSSFLTYGTCTAKLYDGTGWTGSFYGYAASQSSLPTFNDVASSARVH